MKTKNILFAVVILLCASAGWSRAASINQMIASLNADAQKPGGPDRVLKSISASMHVPVTTLEKEKTATNLSYGDLYVAHAIANASGKKFDQLAALKRKGQNWDKIAEENNVSLDGKKKEKKTATTAPTPARKTSVPQAPDMSKGYRSMP
jgi:hypothetical protein